MTTLLSRVAAPLRGIFSTSKRSFFGSNSAGSTVEDDVYKSRTSLPSFSLGGWNKKAGSQQEMQASPAKTKMIQVAPSSSFPEADERESGSEESVRNAAMMWGQVKASVVGETGSDKFAKLVRRERLAPWLQECSAHASSIISAWSLSDWPEISYHPCPLAGFSNNGTRPRQ